MLGKLATYLRMCGHDAAYALDRGSANDAESGDETGNDGGGDGGGIEDDDALLALARGEGRRLVTRDADLAGRASDAILLSAMDIDGQLREPHAAGVDLYGSTALLEGEPLGGRPRASARRVIARRLGGCREVSP